jgi:AraC-like DNA-binding protein
MLTAIVLFGLQGGYYLRECARLLARHTKQSKALFSDIDDQSLNTLRALILVLAMHCVVGVGRGVYGLLLGREAGPNAIFALCEVAVLAWAVFTLPRARTGLDPDERELAEPTVQDKYSRSALDEAVRARIQRKLAEALEVRRLHRDGRLTLRGLCADLRENPHYVSQVINQDLGRSFYDLVNQHRVQDAMTLLAAQPAMPVSEAATEVGFNSRSTFNAAFRQQAGLSPSAWRRKHASAPTGADLPSGT